MSLPDTGLFKAHETVAPAGDNLPAWTGAPRSRCTRTSRDPRHGYAALRTLNAEPLQRYYVFVPKSYVPGRELIVLVHGISRNAREHLLAFAPLAARSGHAVVAPLFSRELCHHYQRLGWTGGERRADLLLRQVVAEVAHDIEALSGPIGLFGHSGGAQFAHRYALAWPGDVGRLVLSAAGNYTFPDPALAYPLGLNWGNVPAGHQPDLRSFLRIPTLVLVGERDTRRDSYLRRDQNLDELQGYNRVERARRWVAALRAAGAGLGVEPQLELGLIPKAGHRFADTMRRGVARTVWSWLTGSVELRGGS